MICKLEEIIGSGLKGTVAAENIGEIGCSSSAVMKAPATSKKNYIF
jgi:hypothetical protein